MKLPTKIKALRKRLGMDQAPFGKLCGVDQSTVSKWETGRQEPDPPGYLALAKLAGTSVEEFMDEDTVNEINADFDPDAVQLSRDPQPGMLIIEELKIACGMSHGGPVDEFQGMGAGNRVVARWEMPADVIRAHTRAPADKVKIIMATGESNKPEILPGERLMIDTSDVTPSPAGFFAIWDGLNEVVKRLEFIPYSSPKKVLMLSANPAYPPREYLLDDLIVNGRVVGRWDRL